MPLPGPPPSSPPPPTPASLPVPPRRPRSSRMTSKDWSMELETREMLARVYEEFEGQDAREQQLEQETNLHKSTSADSATSVAHGHDGGRGPGRSPTTAKGQPTPTNVLRAEEQAPRNLSGPDFKTPTFTKREIRPDTPQRYEELNSPSQGRDESSRDQRPRFDLHDAKARVSLSAVRGDHQEWPASPSTGRPSEDGRRSISSNGGPSGLPSTANSIVSSPLVRHLTVRSRTNSTSTANDTTYAPGSDVSSLHDGDMDGDTDTAYQSSYYNSPATVYSEVKKNVDSPRCSGSIKSRKPPSSLGKSSMASLSSPTRADAPWNNAPPTPALGVGTNKVSHGSTEHSYPSVEVGGSGRIQGQVFQHRTEAPDNERGSNAPGSLRDLGVSFPRSSLSADEDLLSAGRKKQISQRELEIEEDRAVAHAEALVLQSGVGNFDASFIAQVSGDESVSQPRRNLQQQQGDRQAFPYEMGFPHPPTTSPVIGRSPSTKSSGASPAIKQSGPSPPVPSFSAKSQRSPTTATPSRAQQQKQQGLLKDNVRLDGPANRKTSFGDLPPSPSRAELLQAVGNVAGADRGKLALAESGRRESSETVMSDREEVKRTSSSAVPSAASVKRSASIAGGKDKPINGAEKKASATSRSSQVAGPYPAASGSTPSIVRSDSQRTKSMGSPAQYHFAAANSAIAQQTRLSPMPVQGGSYFPASASPSESASSSTVTVTDMRGKAKPASVQPHETNSSLNTKASNVTSSAASSNQKATKTPMSPLSASPSSPASSSSQTPTPRPSPARPVRAPPGPPQTQGQRQGESGIKPSKPMEVQERAGDRGVYAEPPKQKQPSSSSNSTQGLAQSQGQSQGQSPMQQTQMQGRTQSAGSAQGQGQGSVQAQGYSHSPSHSQKSNSHAHTQGSHGGSESASVASASSRTNSWDSSSRATSAMDMQDELKSSAHGHVVPLSPTDDSYHSHTSNKSTRSSERSYDHSKLRNTHTEEYYQQGSLYATMPTRQNGTAAGGPAVMPTTPTSARSRNPTDSPDSEALHARPGGSSYDRPRLSSTRRVSSDAVARTVSQKKSSQMRQGAAAAAAAAAAEHEAEDNDDDDDDGAASFHDSEEETEQAHGDVLPPLHPSSYDHLASPRIRVGKGGSRAQPAIKPRKDSLHGEGDLPYDEAVVMSPTEQSMVPASQSAPRRLAGGLSNGAYASAKSSPYFASQPMARTFSDDGASSGGSSVRSIYRPAGGRRSDLGGWAPVASPVYNDNNIIANLPNWNAMKPGDPTSQPISKVERDMDWSMRRLLSEKVFQQLLADPLGRHRFRDYLQSEGCEEMLDFYFDLTQYEVQSRHFKETTEALYDLYVAEDSDSLVRLPQAQSDEIYSSLRRAFEVQNSLHPIQEHVRQTLYKDQFQRFIRSMLIEQNRVKLGVFNEDDEEYTGLGDCFCLTNPRAGTENPIVLVSPGFAEVTGYPTRSILGRNCRFLQGPGTAPESVQRIRDALSAGKPVTELLLNYKRDGTPFFCLLSIIPLRDAANNLSYFLGGQTNVTGTLASSKGLGFLVGSNADHVVEPSAKKNGYEVSPTMARHWTLSAGAGREAGAGLDPGMGHLAKEGNHLSASASTRSLASATTRKQRIAAGAYDPMTGRGPGDDAFMPPKMRTTKGGGIFNNGAISNGSGGGGGGGSTFMSRLLGRNKAQPQIHVGGPQRLLGAEGTVRQAAPARLADQMDFFADLYSRLIVFKRHKREIIFVTPALLHTMGLPTKTTWDVNNSDLLHADLLSLMQGSNKAETKALRGAVQEAIRLGHQISVMTGLRQPRTGLGALLKGDGGEQSIVTYKALHITPLHDRDNSSFAFVAVVG